MRAVLPCLVLCGCASLDVVRQVLPSPLRRSSQVLIEDLPVVDHSDARWPLLQNEKGLQTIAHDLATHLPELRILEQSDRSGPADLILRGELLASRYKRTLAVEARFQLEDISGMITDDFIVRGSSYSMSGYLHQIVEQVSAYLRRRAGLPPCTAAGMIVNSAGVSWCN